MNEQKEFIKPLQEILSDVGIGFSETSSGQLVLDSCYNCGRSKKLYINQENGAYVCFRCDARGGPVKLLKEAIQMNGKTAFELLFGKQGPQSIYEKDDEFDLKVSLTGKKKTTYKSKKELPKPIKLPPYLKPLIPSDTDAWNYLKTKRGLTDEFIKEFNIYHWESAKRVVFLITIDGKIYGTLARDYSGEADKKVLNSSGGWRSFTVWNYDIARYSNDLVICEGVFSAIKCNNETTKAIALFGKTATQGQIEVIRSTDAKKIYICLDVGTDVDQYKLYNQLNLYYPGRIYKIEMPHVIENKKTEGKSSLCKKINKVFKTEISYDNDKNQYLMNYYKDKENILEKCGIDNKMSTDQKLTAVTSFLKNNKSEPFDEKEIKETCWLLLKAEYKDSGDYSFEEMEELILKSKPFKGGPTNW